MRTVRKIGLVVCLLAFLGMQGCGWIEDLRQVARYKADAERLQKKVDAVSKSFKKAVLARQGLQKKLKGMQQALEKAEAEALALQSRVRDLEKNLEALGLENEQLRAKLERYGNGVRRMYD